MNVVNTSKIFESQETGRGGLGIVMMQDEWGEME